MDIPRFQNREIIRKLRLSLSEELKAAKAELKDLDHRAGTGNYKLLDDEDSSKLGFSNVDLKGFPLTMALFQQRRFNVESRISDIKQDLETMDDNPYLAMVLEHFEKREMHPTNLYEERGGSPESHLYRRALNFLMRQGIIIEAEVEVDGFNEHQLVLVRQDRKVKSLAGLLLGVLEEYGPTDSESFREAFEKKHGYELPTAMRLHDFGKYLMRMTAWCDLGIIVRIKTRNIFATPRQEVLSYIAIYKKADEEELTPDTLKEAYDSLKSYQKTYGKTTKEEAENVLTFIKKLLSNPRTITVPKKLGRKKKK